MNLLKSRGIQHLVDLHTIFINHMISNFIYDLYTLIYDLQLDLQVSF